VDWSLKLATAPTTEPLTLAEVRKFLRIDGTGDAEPAPTALTAALASTPIAGNVDVGAHRYRATFVTADGETEGGVVSDVVTVANKTTNGQVSLTAIPLGGSAVTSRKIYRTIAAGTTYLLLTTLSNNTATTYTDNIADASLGAACPAVNTTNDPLLVALLSSARLEIDGADGWLGRALITQTWDLALDGLPSATTHNPNAAIELPLPPLQSVTSIAYIDTNGATQTLTGASLTAVADTDTSSEPGQLRPVYGTSWPDTRLTPRAVTVRFVAGYGAAAAVPAPLALWVRGRIATLYEYREQFVTGTIVAPMSSVNDAMIASYRVGGPYLGLDY